MSDPIRSERTVVIVVAAVQFINVLDFMIVMPLGPDFAAALGIQPSNLGIVGGSYTAAAAVAGLAGATVLDRFGRRKALVTALCGLVVGTAAGALATDVWSLVAARVLAGAFGGPATALAMSIVADVVPPVRRGRAVAAVMTAFVASSVLGVPAGLVLAEWGGWRLPLAVVAALGVPVAVAARVWLPALRGHLDAARPESTRARGGRSTFRPVVLLSYTTTAVVMAAGFLIIPNIPAYLQLNLGVGRSSLDELYLVGGIASFAGLRLSAGWTDRAGSFRAGGVASVLLALVLYAWFVQPLSAVPAWVYVGVFMGALAARNVAYNTLASKVPRVHERARFLAIQSTVQHVASATGAFLSAHLLHARPDGRLAGVAHVAWLSIALTLALPPLLRAVERRLHPIGPTVPSDDDRHASAGGTGGSDVV